MWNFKIVVLVRERGRTVIELNKIATEQSNERSKNIDKTSTLEMLTIINEEDKEVPRAIARILPQIAVAVDCIAERLKRGGRLFYIGAGTSGRLGILDAAECPPTYSTDPEMVQGIIAGGYAAIFKAQEGAEDSEEMARTDLKAKKIQETDVVVGLTASGRTPYVIGGLKYALECGAATIGITCTNNAETTPWTQIQLTALVGPEVVTGSTRMKAGTAQKLILNMLSTGTMIKLGKVYGNLMIDVKASNKKLEERALRIVMKATNCDRKVAKIALEKSEGSARAAVLMILSDLNPEEAKKHSAMIKV
ncbi:N-acetylmuramic acid 6-phosphate etherase [bioreactor metagenome]|jgi:N-acetylmuramic acid 6-phosphate etherase|uniref:N-acetylmuramic acid 6-phosphate etherase n=1 Tax=bioreactor metagenome TaxID=1076179 RepID=A0A644UMM2_9ZZZZ